MKRSSNSDSPTRAIVITAALTQNILALLGASDSPIGWRARGEVEGRLMTELAGAPSFSSIRHRDLLELERQVREERERRGLPPG